MRTVGVKARVGAQIIALAGPRTRDVIQLAHEVTELARSSGTATMDHVVEGFARIVAGEDAVLRVLWAQLTPLQQNVLRALATSATGLTTSERRRVFTLGQSGAATKAAQTLIDHDILVKTNDGYRYDSPFTRGWVLLNALADAGITLPITHQPG
jgi:putative NADH-flavin reductase